MTLRQGDAGLRVIGDVILVMSGIKHDADDFLLFFIGQGCPFGEQVLGKLQSMTDEGFAEVVLESVE